MTALNDASRELQSSFPKARTLVLFHPPQDIGLMAPYAWEVLDERGDVLVTRGSWAETPALVALALSLAGAGVEHASRDKFWLRVPLR
jgi:hypothetical protein